MESVIQNGEYNCSKNVDMKLFRRLWHVIESTTKQILHTCVSSLTMTIFFVNSLQSFDRATQKILTVCHVL